MTIHRRSLFFLTGRLGWNFNVVGNVWWLLWALCTGMPDRHVFPWKAWGAPDLLRHLVDFSSVAEWDEKFGWRWDEFTNILSGLTLSMQIYIKFDHETAAPQSTFLPRRMSVAQDTLFQSFMSVVFISLTLYGFFFVADLMMPTNSLGMAIVLTLFTAVSTTLWTESLSLGLF